MDGCSFTFQTYRSLNGVRYDWVVTMPGYQLTGAARSRRSMMRQAKRAIRRHRRIMKLIREAAGT